MWLFVQLLARIRGNLKNFTCSYLFLYYWLLCTLWLIVDLEQGDFNQEYINGEYATPIWGVNTALAKDDVRSRCRLVVNIIK